MKKTKLIVLCAIPLLTFSCRKPKDEPQIIDDGGIKTESVIIANEGSFGNANAEISYINGADPTTIYNDAFKAKNNNAVLGDVLQSISFKNNLMYCVMNNSGAIKVLNNDYSLNTTITNLNSPRYIGFINNNTALITSLAFNTNSNPLQLFNPTNNSLGSKLPMKGWSEGVLIHGKYTYICNYTLSKLYKLDNNTLQYVDSVKLGLGLKEVIQYKNGNLLLLTDGKYLNPNNPSQLFTIDTASLNPIDSANLSTSGYSGLYYSQSKNSILVLGANRLETVSTTNYTSQTLIASLQGETFYGFGYDEKYKRFYICDAKDFQQKGQVIICDENGNRLRSLGAGVGTAKVYFNY